MNAIMPGSSSSAAAAAVRTQIANSGRNPSLQTLIYHVSALLCVQRPQSRLQLAAPSYLALMAPGGTANSEDEHEAAFVHNVSSALQSLGVVTPQNTSRGSGNFNLGLGGGLGTGLAFRGRH